MPHTLRVSSNPRKDAPDSPTGKPAHWVDEAGTAFQNPWASWYTMSAIDTIRFISNSHNWPSPPKDPSTVVALRTPTWGTASTENKDKIKATWLGHACFLVELPARGAQPRGARILFDPVFSDRCSPSQLIGPKRFTQPPCKLEEIPDIDAIVISHNHYDHLDTTTIRALFARTPIPHIFVPLGNAPYLASIGVPKSNAHVLDWWESRQLEITLGGTAGVDGGKGKKTEEGKEGVKVKVDITCTPGQHFTGRGLFDRFKTLWAGWAVEEVPSSSLAASPSAPTPDAGSPASTDTASARPPVKIYFAGDTGYRSVQPHQDEDSVPVCPAFAEIGRRFGGFEFAMLPIGAYQPRRYMSPVHCAPQDSVRIFKDVKAKKALGMHWGTWILTAEAVSEPPQRLAEECKKQGLEQDAFNVCDIGETLFF